MRELCEQYANSYTLYSYQGNLSQSTMEHIVFEVKNRLIKEEIIPKIISCVYSVLVEGIQNMIRYCYVKEGEPVQGLVLVLKEEIGFRIILGNYIDKNCEAKMIYQLEKFNFMSEEELKAKLCQCRRSNDLRENCSAGLGLMEIARRATGKLQYQLIKRSPEYSVFLLEVVV